MGLGKPHIFWRSPPSSAEGLRRFHITLTSRQTKPFHRLHRAQGLAMLLPHPQSYPAHQLVP